MGRGLEDEEAWSALGSGCGRGGWATSERRYDGRSGASDLFFSDLCSRPCEGRRGGGTFLRRRNSGISHEAAEGWLARSETMSKRGELPGTWTFFSSPLCLHSFAALHVCVVMSFAWHRGAAVVIINLCFPPLARLLANLSSGEIASMSYVRRYF